MSRNQPATVLVIDDDSAMRDMLHEDLERRGYQVLTADGAGRAWELLAGHDVDMVLTDLNMPGTSGIDFCRQLHQDRPDLPVLIITAFGSLETAIDALRAGAYDFVTKPIDLDLLEHALRRARQHRELQRKVQLLDAEIARSRPSTDILGDSPPMRELKDLLGRVAPLDTSVLITGESGTGKELAARALHRLSGRQGTFVAVNCAALPETLLESELFGHRRGAFTDARESRPGLFLEADGGTLLLDEIGEMPLALQPKLLRAIEEKRIRPVGGGREISVDVRILTATHQDLEEAVAAGRFREDLLYRLNVISIELPPLRDRGNDILLLAQSFCSEFADRMGKPVKGLSEPAAARLLAYDWPGNIRELRNVIERAVALTRHDRLTPDDFPPRLQQDTHHRQVPELAADTPLLPLAEVERRYIERVLESCGGNRTVAARILGIDRKTLYRKLQAGERPR
ncbi:DNA-binding NtrC family response regulator [Geothermobacter ehrlichii]|uniref:DNA-binding NtrC family response regulator n=1 Tax=Geothermobacter ehrlichii TaxID=213224 RepID=A0A5D3WMA7_9BACT|nr:sigma-54 dependent transcriptional regulator [Geothermobacter ehrlichii]TYO99333.1 DNA-binding NtrC family response regulator [Geothermobacter ehrlichii]